MAAAPKPPVLGPLAQARAERAMITKQTSKARDARARKSAIDHLFQISHHHLARFAKLHELPQGEDRVPYPLSTPFATYVDREIERGKRAQLAHETLLREAHPVSLLQARRRLRAQEPGLSRLFEAYQYGGLSQRALAREAGLTQSAVCKRLARAVRLLTAWVQPPLPEQDVPPVAAAAGAAVAEQIDGSGATVAGGESKPLYTI